MKKCAICGAESPSVSLYCSQCGSPLSDEQLPLEISLQKELAEAKEQLAISAMHLRDADAHSKFAIEEEKRYRSMYEEQRGELEKLKEEYNIANIQKDKSIERERQKTAKHRAAWIVLLCLFLIAGGIAAYLFNLYQETNFEKELLQSEDERKANIINNQNDRIVSLTDSIARLNNNLKKQKLPLTFGTMFLYNLKNGEEKAIQQFTWKEGFCRLKIRMQITSSTEGDYTLFYKIVQPNGAVMSHKGSPKGYTDSQRIHIWQGTDTYDINRGYGWNDGGYWQRGEHWVEIYLNGVKVATQNFTVE